MVLDRQELKRSSHSRVRSHSTLMVWVLQRKAPRRVVCRRRLLVADDDVVLQAPVLHPLRDAPRPQDLLTWLPRHFGRRRDASRAGEVFLKTGGVTGGVKDGLCWWVSRTGFGWTLNGVVERVCLRVAVSS